MKWFEHGQRMWKYIIVNDRSSIWVIKGLNFEHSGAIPIQIGKVNVKESG